MSELEGTPLEENAPDTEMAEVEETTEGAEGSAEASAELPFAEEPVEEARQTFMGYLMSPVVSLLVGQAGSEQVLTAHQALLSKSPYFKEACASFAEDTVRLSILPFPAPLRMFYAVTVAEDRRGSAQVC